ncbi:MAG: hypothetical protein JXA42_11005 [Anaerolineales bacterium]|nr:hypothetical protein [Anaerolineales bacterium]
MPFYILGKPNFQQAETPAGVYIRIPSKKNWILILFMIIILIMMTKFNVMIVSDLFWAVIQKKSIEFNFIGVLVFVAMFGLLVLFWILDFSSLLWQVFGVETIHVSGNTLVIDKKPPFWNRPKTFKLDRIVSLRVSDPPTPIITTALTIGGGWLAFEYDGKTVRFGIGLGREEAERYLKDIQLHYPDLVEI